MSRQSGENKLESIDTEQETVENARKDEEHVHRGSKAIEATRRKRSPIAAALSLALGVLGCISSTADEEWKPSR